MIRVRGRSFMAFVIGAASPLEEWLDDLAQQIERIRTPGCRPWSRRWLRAVSG
jgi:hypothetical protein